MTTAPFTENNDVRSHTGGADFVEAGAGDDFVRALAGDDKVFGEEGADVLLGAAGADTLDGGTGDDILTGGAGNDVLIGDNGLDTATYDLASLTASQFAVVSGSWTVDAGGPEGTDRLSGIEVVTDQLGARFLLVGSGGFATIQAAVDAATDGDTIVLAGGTLTGDVTITGKSLTFTGQGVDATTIAGQISLAGDMAGKTLTIQDLTVDAAGKQYGLQLRSTGGSLVVDDAAIANASVNGIFYAHPSNGSQPTTKTDLLQSVSISDTTFENNGHYNGTVGGPGGRGHISLFGFNGTLTATNNDFISTGPAFIGPTQPSGAIYKAISVVGAGRPVGGTAQALLGTDPAAEVQGQISPLAGATLTGNSFEGNYTQDLISFYYFTSIALTASGNTTTGVEAPWGLLNFDAVGGSVDVSGFFTGATNGQGYGASLQGLATDGSLKGTDLSDLIDGRAGVDNIDAGAGDDVIRISQSSAHGATETINGGEGDDVILFNPATADTLVLSASVTNVESAAVVGAHPAYLASGVVAGNIDASAVTGLQRLTGNEGANALTGGADAQTIRGNGGDDVLAGGGGDDTLDGGAGHDTMIDGDGSDEFDGGDGTDTIVLDGSYADYVLTFVDGGLQISRAGEADMIVNAERLSFADKSVWLVDTAGTLSDVTSIQSAIDSAAAEDVILVAAGNYAEATVTIDKSLTLLGANFGSPGNGEREAESSLVGSFRVAADGVTIDGFQIGGAADAIRAHLAGAAYDDLTIQNNLITNTTDSPIRFGLGFGGGIGSENWMITQNAINGITGNAQTAMVLFNVTGLEVTDNVISHTEPGTGRRGINLDGIQDGMISGNTIDMGWAPDSNVSNSANETAANTGAPWAVQVSMSDRAASNLTITDNDISGARYGVLTLNNGNASGIAITGNTIADAYHGIGLQVGSVASTSTQVDISVTDNEIDAYFAGIRFGSTVVNGSNDAYADLVVADNAITVASLTGVPLWMPLAHNTTTSGTGAEIEGTAGGDLIQIAFGEGADQLSGGAGNDTLSGAGGDDALLGGADDDVLDGGAGADVISGGAGADLIRISKATDFAAGESIDGEEGSDTLEFNPGTAETLVLSADVINVETVSLAAGSVAAGIDASAVVGVARMLGNNGANELSGGADAQNIEGLGGDDVLAGGGGDDTLLGGDGTDELKGGAGADTLDGGAETADAVIYEGNYADYTFSMSGGALLVTRNGETDTLLNVEKLTFADRTAWVVDNAGTASDLLTIQSAVDAASANQIILVAPGTYAENVTINKNGLKLFSVEGAATTIIAGNPDGVQLGAVQFTAGLSGVQLGATGQGFRIEGLNGNGPVEKAAVYLTGNQTGHLIQGNVVVAQGDAGLKSEIAGALTSVTIDRNEFAGQTFTGVQPTQAGSATQFDLGNNVARQLVVLGNGGGAGASSSDDVDFTNNLVSGTTGGGSFGNSMVTIDVSNATASGNEFTGVTAGSGVALRMRRDGATITDNILDGTDGGESRGMLIQNQTSGTYTGNQFLGGSDADTITGMTPGADSLSGDGGDDVLAASAGADTLDGGTGADALDGGDGSDILVGGEGNDVLDGGNGADKVLYVADLTAEDISATGGTWRVAADAEGMDSLYGIEVVETAGGARFHLVGTGGYASINAAIAAATEGDTILVSAGTYDEAVNVNKAVTILGANFGIDGDGDRNGETVITGLSQVTAASGDVVLSGIEFRYTGAVNSLLGSMNGGSMLQLTGGATVVVEDSRFIAMTVQGDADAGGGGRAIYVPTGFAGNLTFDGNFFGGPALSGFSGANWQRGIWSDGTATSLTITDNVFNYVRSALNLDGYDDASVSNISGNTFANSGSGISFGKNGDASPLGVSNNVFSNVDSDFNLQNLIVPVVFSVGDNTASVVGTDSYVKVLGGTAGDSLTGGSGDDFLVGNNGADTLSGGGGNDLLFGGAGSDILIGDAGTDTAIYTGATTFIRNFDGSISAYNAGGNDLLSGVEFAVVDGGAAIALGDLPTTTVSVELVTDSGTAGDDLSNSASVRGTGRALTDLTVTWVSGATTRETTVLVGADGTWSATLPATLPDGEVTVTVTQADGNGGTDGDTLGFSYDTATETPTIDLVSDSGADTSDDLTNDNTPTFSGTAEAGSVVGIYRVGGLLVGSTTADENGDWTATLTTQLIDGSHAFEVVATDAAGNAATSGALTIAVDATAPTTPTLDLIAASDSADDEDDVTRETMPTLAGSADTGSVVWLYAGSDLVGTTVAAGGSWSISSSVLVDGDYVFTVESEDAAGNISTSAALPVTIDSTDPVTPMLDLVAASDTGASSTDNLTSETAPTFLVTGEAGTEVVLYSGATVVASGTIGDLNTVELTAATLAQGSNILTVVSTDTAGNSATSAPLEVMVDATAAAPTIDLDAGSDSGASATDNITKDLTPSFSGTAEAGASITILRDNAVVHTTTADGSGNWSWNSGLLSDGGYGFSVRSEDPSGNIAASGTLAVTIDATAPAAPVLTAAVLTSTAGGTFVLSGTAEANLLVTVLAGATVLGTTTADCNGNWNFDYAGVPLVAGSYDLTATTADTAGNDSAASVAYALVVAAQGGQLIGGIGNDSLGGGAGNDTLTGGAGDNTLNGGDGTGDVASYAAGAGVTVNLAAGTQTYNDADGGDTLIEIEGVIGSAQGDYLYGSGAANMLAGGAGDDVMDGDAGNDTLSGGAGADEMAGGEGFDTATYSGSAAGVRVSLATGLGSGGDAEGDQLFSFEALVGSDGADSLGGDGGANRLDGGTGNDTLLGGFGGDTLIGGLGFDVVSYEGSPAVNVNLGTGILAGGDAANDILSGIEGVIGGSGSDLLTGNADANLLEGRNGNGSLSGAGGDDTILGGSGVDTLSGGNGNDSLNGGDGGDSLSGGDGNDILRGDAGADSLGGGAGNDTYYVDGLDTVQEAVGGGRDVIYASASFTLTAGLEIEEFRGLAGGLQLVGNERGNEIYGGSGNDTLNGAAGADVLVGNGGADLLIGGTDSDTYYVDALDTVQEAVGGGTDAVFASANFTLGAGQEIEVLRALAGSAGLRLAGNELVNTVLGDAGADTLSGGAGNDTLAGGGGNDILTGDAGADSLSGGAGNDTYYVEGLDTVQEAVGGGTDVVFASANFTLTAGQEIEVLQALSGSVGLRLTGNGLANTVLGDAGADTLFGGAGNDTLSGGEGNDILYGDAGADSLSGGAGNDTYYVDGLDTVQEAVGGGRDVIYASASFTLTAGLEIEEFRGLGGGLQLVGNERGNEIYGGSGNDTLNGATGADVLVGNGGADLLIGGAGIDTVYGGAGQDVFFLSNLFADRDVIADFVGGTDFLQVSVAAFGGGLAAGPLAADQFLANATGLAGDADDRFIYNTSSGILFYDLDGAGAGGPIQVATLSGVPTLTASDFILVG